MALPPLQSLSLEGMLTPDGELDPTRLLYGTNQFFGGVYGALNRGLSFGENFRATVKDVRFTMPSDAPWRTVASSGTIEPYFKNSWTPEDDATYHAAACCMFPLGIVRLRGVMDAGTIGSAAFTLPSGWRPNRKMWFAAGCEVEGVAPTIGFVVVDTSGNVIPKYGDNASFALDGIQFQVAGSTVAPPDAFTGSYQGTTWPLVVSHGLTRCRSVAVVGCAMKDAKLTQSTGHFWPDWEDKGDGQIRIKSVWGLQWGQTYTLRLLMFQE